MRLRMESCLLDVRVAVRGLIRRPALTHRDPRRIARSRNATHRGVQRRRPDLFRPLPMQIRIGLSRYPHRSAGDK